MLTLNAIGIELGKSYRHLNEMSGILKEIGLTRLPHLTVLRDWLETIPMARWRAFLGVSAEKRTGHAVIDSTGFDRDHLAVLRPAGALPRPVVESHCLRRCRNAVRYQRPLHHHEETQYEDQSAGRPT